ncbi:Abi family protein [Campylobacter hominis]|uniref:Abi family protein n=1 Tax=Campylobacter hominis TaxID=76517 RepID=UPI00248AF6C7|nr:Abi family protein [Campylobacter hominis]
MFQVVVTELKKYGKDLAIWNFIEIIQFGSLIAFVCFFYERYPNKEFNKIKNGLHNIKFLRNSAAHNNSMLANLKDNINSPQNDVINEIYRLKIFKNKTRNYIKNQMKNRTINDFIVALFIYNKICKSKTMKLHCFDDLHKLFQNRLIRNYNYYKRSKTIKQRYLFCLRIIKYFQKFK